MSFIKTGLDALDAIEKQAEVEKSRGGDSKFLNMWLKDNEKTVVLFLLDHPCTFHQHSYGPKGQDKYICTDPNNGCALCRHTKSNPSQRGCIPLIRVDAPDYVDKEGVARNQTDRVWLWEFSNTTASSLAAYIAEVKELRKQPTRITRKRAGEKSINYPLFPVAEKPELSEEQKALYKIKWTDDLWEEVFHTQYGYPRVPDSDEIKRIINVYGDGTYPSLDREEEDDNEGPPFDSEGELVEDESYRKAESYV